MSEPLSTRRLSQVAVPALYVFPHMCRISEGRFEKSHAGLRSQSVFPQMVPDCESVRSALNHSPQGLPVLRGSEVGDCNARLHADTFGVGLLLNKSIITCILHASAYWWNSVTISLLICFRSFFCLCCRDGSPRDSSDNMFVSLCAHGNTLMISILPT